MGHSAFLAGGGLRGAGKTPGQSFWRHALDSWFPASAQPGRKNPHLHASITPPIATLQVRAHRTTPQGPG